jgi:hypothetical protein
MRQVVDHALADRRRLDLRQLVRKAATMWSFSAAPWLLKNSVAWREVVVEARAAPAHLRRIEPVLDALVTLVPPSTRNSVPLPSVLGS